MNKYIIRGTKEITVTPEIQAAITKALAEYRPEGCKEGRYYCEENGRSAEGMDFGTELWLPFTLEVEAPARGGPDGAFRQVIEKHIWRSGSIDHVEGWYSSDVVLGVNGALQKAIFGGPFTEEEQADPDIILTSLPEGSTNTAIRAARKRRHRLRRLLLARTFAQSNPDLSFHLNGRTYLNRLVIKVEGFDPWEGLRVSFVSQCFRVRLSHDLLPGGSQLIEATDAHQVEQIIDFLENYQQPPEPGHSCGIVTEQLEDPQAITDEDIPF